MSDTYDNYMNPISNNTPSLGSRMKRGMKSDLTGECSRKITMYAGGIILISVIMMFILFFVTKGIYSKEAEETKKAAATRNATAHAQEQMRKAEIARLQKLLNDARMGGSVSRSYPVVKKISETPRRIQI